MSLRGRVMRRKYSEWTLEPKSIQSQRAQLAGLLEAFHAFPFGASGGSMLTVRNQLRTEGYFIGKFPYPTIYPSSMESALPVSTTQWARFMPFWQYTGWGTRTSAAYAIGYIVVDVTTDPKTPRVKSSGAIGVNGGSGECLETIVPCATGAWLLCTTNPHVSTPLWELETVTFSSKDELYVCMAFTAETTPLNNTNAALTYYLQPASVLKPQV